MTYRDRIGYDASGRYHVPDPAKYKGRGEWPATPRDQCDDCRCAPNMPHSPDCDGASQMSGSVINTAPEHVESCVPEGSREHRSVPQPDNPFPEALYDLMDNASSLRSDDNLDDGEKLIKVTSCPVCCQQMDPGETIDCDHCEEPIAVESFAVVNGPGGVFVYHLHCYDEVYHPDDGRDDDEASLDYDEGWHGDPSGVPFRVQEWMFESLCEVEIDKLHDLIDDHHDLIIEMARERHKKGYARFRSEMYSWSPERRLDETLQELADAVVYPTSGPIE